MPATAASSAEKSTREARSTSLKLDDYRLTKELIRSRCNEHNIILVTFVNSKRADYGYTWAAHSCEPCRPISNATAGATYLCTNADDSRLCPAEVAAGSPACADRDGCIEGHFRSPALSVLASDVCAPCSGMADVASLINCTECINATSAGCLTGNCAPGYHTVK